MNKFMRKKQLRNRVIAFVMAVAMVITVVRVNSNSSTVKAGEGDTAGVYSDLNYLTTKLETSGIIEEAANDALENGTATCKNYTVYSAAENIGFTLPDVSAFSETQTKYCVSNGAGGISVLDTLPDGTESYIIISRDYTLSWDGTLLASETTRKLTLNGTAADLDESNCTDEEFKTLVENDTDINAVISLDLIELSYQYTSYTFGATVDQATRTVTINDETPDNWVDDIDAGQFYYGKFSYGVRSTSKPENSWEEFQATNRYTNTPWYDAPEDAVAEVTADGTYWIMRRYVTEIEEGDEETGKTPLYFTETGIKKEVNFSFIKALTVTAGSVTKTLDASELLASPKNVTLEGVDPSEDIVISVTLDEAGNVGFNGGDTILLADTPMDFTIDADKDTNNGQTGVAYTNVMTFENSDSTLTDSLSLTVSYIDISVAISDVKVNNTDASSYATEPLYTKELPEISAKADAKGKVKVNEVTLMNVGTESDSAVHAFTIEEAAASVTVSETLADGEITEGLNVLYIAAKNDHNETADTKAAAFKVFYDKTAPVIGAVTFSQNGTALDIASGNDKITSQKDILVSFPITEAGSGVDTATLTFNGIDYAAALNGDVYEATVPAADISSLYEGTVSPDWEINAVDKAGNESTPKSGNVKVYKEPATITITPAIDTVTPVENKDYLDVTDETYNTVQLKYTVKVESEVEIDADKVTAEDKDGNAVTLIRDDTKTTFANGIYTYIYESAAVNISETTYKLSVESENKNGYVSSGESKIYYVDITAPDAALTGNTAEDGNGDEVTSGVVEWHKSVYVIVSGISDNKNTNDTGVDYTTVAVTGMEQISADTASGQYIYKVAESTSTAGTSVSFEVKDKIGNKKSLTGQFYVDNTIPVVGYNKSGESAITENYLLVDGTVIDNTVTTVYKTGDFTVAAKGSDNIAVDHITYRLSKGGSLLNHVDKNSGEEINISDIANGEFDGTKLNDGVYTLSAQVFDKAGNESAKRMLSIVIDSRTPEAGITVVSGINTAPKTTGTITGDKAVATYVDPDDAAGNYDYYRFTQGPVKLTFTVKDDNVKPENITVTDGDGNVLTGNAEDPWNWTKTTDGYTITKEFSAAGYHVIKISATDESGNASKTDPNQRLAFYIDKTSNKATITLNGNDSSTYDTDEATNCIIFDGDVELGCIQSEVSPYLDEADVEAKIVKTAPGKTSISSSDTDTESLKNGGTKTFSDEGKYEIQITTRDMAGNKATTDYVRFIIDKSNPDLGLKLTGESPKTSKYFTSNVGITITLTDFYPESCELSYEIVGSEKKQKALSFNPELTSVSADGKYIAKTSFSEQGHYKITVTAKDKAGHKCNATEEFWIDKDEPVLKLLLNGAAAPEKTNDDAALYRLNEDAVISYTLKDATNDPTDVLLSYEYTGFDGTSESKKNVDFGTNAETSRTFTKDGKYVITVKATDLAGNTTTSYTAFIIDTTSPEIEIEKVTGDSPKMDKFPKEYTHNSDHFSRTFKYGEYYNSETVKVTINIFESDADLAAEPFTVYDNKTKIEASKAVFKEKKNGVYTCTVEISGEGKHHITVSAVDRTGNKGDSNGVDFIIDNTDPELTLLLNGKKDFEKDLRIDGQGKVSYELKDSYEDLTDVKLTYVYTPAGGTAGASKTEELYNNASRIFPDSAKGEGDGKYEVYITAIDKAGNKTVTEKASFIIDTTDPELDLKIKNAAPAKMSKYSNNYKPLVEGHFTAAKNGYTYGQYYKEDVNILVTVFDFDPANFSVTDNGNPVDASFSDNGNGEYTAEITITGDGQHKIAASSNDNAGNAGKSSELSFTIDTKAPELKPTLDSKPYTESNSFRGPDAVVGITVEDDNKDTDDLYRTYKIELSDGSNVLEDAGYIEETVEVFKYDAFYTFTYKAVDRAGNESSVTIGFTIDTNGPQSDIIITTDAPAKMDKYHNEYSNTAGHFNTAYTYGQYYAGSVSMDIKVFEYNVDSIVVTDNGSSVTPSFTQVGGGEWVVRNFTRSSEGVHEIEVTVTDKAGHTSTKGVTFEIDTIAPDLYATLNSSSDITDRYLPEDAAVTLGISDTNKDSDDVTRTVSMTRPSASAEVTTVTGDLEGSESYSVEADYEITYKAVDKAGNESSELKLSFRVDKTAPVLTITGIEKGATAADDVTVTYGMEEAFYWDMISAVINIYKKVDGSSETLYKTVEFDAKTANDTMTEVFSEDGQYRFEFTAEDKTGNKADESFVFLLDKNAPLVVLTGVDKYLTDQDVTLGVKIEETFFTGNVVKFEGTVKTLEHPEGVPIDFEDYSVLTSSSSAYFEQVFKEDGIYDIRVISKDKAGNETVQHVQFTIDKTKPLIKDLEDLANEEEYQAYSEAINSNTPGAKKLLPIFNSFDFDYDDDEIVVDLTTVTYQLYMDDVLYDGLSKVEDGFHELKVTAEDEIGNKSERSFYFRLDTAAPVIIVTGVESGNNLKKPTTVTVALQLEEDTLQSVTLNGTAINIEGNTASFEVSEKGDYDLAIKAVDDAGNESAQTISFEYGKSGNLLWIILAIAAGVIILGGAGFVVLGKKRKENQ